MHIHFGIQLDGLHPLASAMAGTRLGELCVGRLGLLRWLETELGLPPVVAHPTEQLMAFRDCLDELAHLQHFYSRSYAVDPLNVARTLMSWREQWYEAGWDGSQHITASARLHDMFTLEQLARPRVPLCFGQRVQRILEELQAGAVTQITCLTLYDDIAQLPYVWQQLLSGLQAHTAAGVEARPGADADSDLGLVQRQLLQFAEQPRVAVKGRQALRGDGSLLVVRATSRDVSAQWLAETVASQSTGQRAQTVVVAERDGIVVDNALQRSGLPRCGFTHLSRSRPLNQIIKLALGLLWAPVDPHQLLQFLLHPLAPLPAAIRRRLAAAVANQPGIGGQAWQAALADIQATYDAQGVSDKIIRQRLQQIDDWLNQPRFDPEQGAPIEVLLLRVNACRNWLAGQLGSLSVQADQTAEQDSEQQPDPDQHAQRDQAVHQPGQVELYAAALAQINALAAALQQLLPRNRLSKVEMDRLLHDVTRPAPDASLFAQANHVAASEYAQYVTQSWSQVVWWDLRASTPALTEIWSAAERLELLAAGIRLPEPRTILRGHALARLRPLLNCSQRFVMIVHDEERGQHPLWQQLCTAFSGWQELDLDDVLLRGADDDLLTVAAPELEQRKLPRRQDHWQLPADVSLQPRTVESYSSLSKLFFHPHEWVLNYAARLRSGHAEDLADGNLLYGNLAHRLFEMFFQQHADWPQLDDQTLVNWCQQTLPDLISAESAVLLESGRGVDRQRVSTILEQSLVRLLRHLRSAGVVHVQAEQREQRRYVAGVELQGSIDLLLTDVDGREIVMDAKWGGQKYRGDELRNNQHLQLLSYAYLRSQPATALTTPAAAATPPLSGAWPQMVYFIISTGNVLARDNSLFPAALTFSPAEVIAAEQLWQRGINTYRWRMQQLSRGHIELAVDGERQQPLPADLLSLDNGSNPFDEYTLLLGWDGFA